MRQFTRIVLATAAIAFGAASNNLSAQSQDPEPAPVVIPEPAEQIIIAPADEAPAVEQVITAPADEAPTIEQEDAQPVAAPVIEGPVPVVVETAPLEPPPPAAPTVDNSASYWPPTPVEEPARGQKGSDWIFLGIVALAVIVILVRLTRERKESVSIRDERFPPSSAGPPIVRHS